MEEKPHCGLMQILCRFSVTPLGLLSQHPLIQSLLFRVCLPRASLPISNHLRGFMNLIAKFLRVFQLRMY